MTTLDELHYLQRLQDKGNNPYNPFTWITGEPKIGRGTWIGAFCLIDGLGGLEIGEDCNISSGAHIITHSTVVRCVSGKGEMEKRSVRIGNNVFIGENATILMGCDLWDRCVIGAGSVVREDTQILTDFIYTGNPARPVRRMSPSKTAEHQVLVSCRCRFDKDDRFEFHVWESCEEHT